MVAGVYGGLKIHLGYTGLAAVPQAADDVTLQALAALVILDGDVALEDDDDNGGGMYCVTYVEVNEKTIPYIVINY